MRLIVGLLALTLGIEAALAQAGRAPESDIDRPRPLKKTHKSVTDKKSNPGPATDLRDGSFRDGNSRDGHPRGAASPETLFRNAGRPGPGDCTAWERKLPINPAGVHIHVGLKTYAETLALQDHEIVLTFDDGPWPETTPVILDALREACAHATFFLIGKRTRLAPDLARREEREGHTVGHHSDTHPLFTLRGFDTKSAIADIRNGIESDERNIYGGDARPSDSPHVPFFRFPGFADTRETLEFLDKHHYAVFGTDLWAADWLLMSPDHERERVLRLLEEAPHHNGIILFHDNVRSTAKMLPGLLAELRLRNYRIVHLVYDETAGPPALTPPIEGWRAEDSETERIIRHLRKKIVPGSHHAGQPASDPGPAPGDALDGGPQ